MNYKEEIMTDIMINDKDNPEIHTNIANSYVNPSNSLPVTTASINITSNIASNATSRPATLPISSPFGPPSDNNLSTMVKSSTTGDLNATGLVASLATPKGTPIDAIKEWSISTYKCTKQLVNERLGKCQRSVDSVLETEIDRLKDTQKKYTQILKLSRDMMTMYSSLINHQQLLLENFNELAMKENKVESSNLTNGNSSESLSLTVDFKQNATMLKNISENGKKLIQALKFFISNLNTLIYKTIEDTMITIRAFENARLEYDAEKNSVANLLPAQAASTANTEKLIATKAKYERLKEDVAIKLQFLDENKTKVMHKQLILFYHAFASYASGNASSLESTLKQFSIKATSPPSWLEK